MPHTRAIADEPDWEEITALSRFRQRAGGASAVIVIHDVATDQPIAQHRVPVLREEHLVIKVDGAGHGGRYYWAKTSRIAHELSARHCQHPGDERPAAVRMRWPRRCGPHVSEPRCGVREGSGSADGRDA